MNYFMKDQLNPKTKLNNFWNSMRCEFWDWPEGMIEKGKKVIAGKILDHLAHF